MMPTLPSADIRFDLRVDRLPDVEFLGPTIRGMIGHGLRRAYCGHASDALGRCSARHTCRYARLFEGASARADALSLPMGFTPPPPFVLEVDQAYRSPQASASRHGRVRFTVRLFGTAIADTSALIEAIAVRQRFGLGAQSRRFEIVGVTRRNEIQDGVQGDSAYSADYCQETCAGVGLLEIHFLTPMSLRQGQRVQPCVNPELLVSAARRRDWLMRALHGTPLDTDAEMPRQPHPTSAFRVRRDMTRLWRMRRRSGRQHRAVPMEGLVGSATIEGPWARERWIGDLARLHVGKYAAFGFGQVALNIQGRRRPPFSPVITARFASLPLQGP